MNYKKVKMTVCTLAATIAFTGADIAAEAKTGENLSGSNLRTMTQKEGKQQKIALDASENGVFGLGELILATGPTRALEELSEEVQFKNLVIAQVDSYVNVRSIPSEEGEILGKLYDDSVGTFLGEENGWYLISSGNVTGYVKGEYCVTGDAAVEIAKQVRKRIATVTTQTLFVRKEPTTESAIIGMVPEADQLVVSDETDGWVQVEVEEGIGWVSMDYVTLHNEFVHAESKEEEAKRLAKEEAERKAAQEAARKAAAKSNSANASKSSSSSKNSSASGNNSSSNSTSSNQSSTSGDMGRAVADYALQFLGNPYVYGGNSLTKGTDCSGFVKGVYANFGVSLPRTSGEQRSSGYAVSGLSNAQPGDLVCYSGHIGIYIGDGQIVHASSAKTGIIISNATYREILAIRRIF